MKISDIKLEEASDGGADLKLLHPVTEEVLKNEDEKPMVIRLVGKDSKQFRKASARIANREVKKRSKNITVEKTEANGCELLAACTLGWNVAIDDDKPAKFSTEAAQELYEKHPWVKEQVDIFVGDRGNFLVSA